MIEGETPVLPGEQIQQQVEEQQESRDNPKAKYIADFLKSMSSYQTEENSTEDGSYKVILFRQNKSLDLAISLQNLFNVSGISIRDIDGRNHEITWNPKKVR